MNFCRFLIIASSLVLALANEFSLLQPAFAAKRKSTSTLKVSTSSVDFGVLAKGGTAVRTLRIRNISKKRTARTITLRKFRLSGPHSDSFKIKGKKATQILPGKAVRIKVVFTPSSTGAQSAFLTLNSTGKPKKVLITLHGTGAEDSAARTAITGVNPASGSMGSTVTLSGYGFGNDPSAIQLFFSQWEVPIVSMTDTQIVARVPHFKPAFVWDGKYGQNFYGKKENEFFYGASFLVTGITPSAPRCVASSYYILYPDNACIGDRVTLVVQGASPRAEQNLVSFNGTQTKGISFTKNPSVENWGYLDVIVPAGASSGTLRIKRMDGYLDDWGEGFDFTVNPSSNLTISAGLESGGIINPFPRLKRSPIYDYEPIEGQLLVLSGQDFSRLCIGEHCSRFQAELVADSGERLLSCQPQSDTRAECFISREIFEELNLSTGKNFSVRVKGHDEKNRIMRYSNWIALTVRDEAVLGGRHDVQLGGNTSALTIARGDVLVLQNGNRFEIQRAIAPGLWDGELLFSSEGTGLESDTGIYGLQAKAFRMDHTGEYTIRLADGSWSKKIYVENGPIPHSSTEVLAAIPEGGGTLGFGGGRISIPQGALPVQPITIQVDNQAGIRNSRDPLQTDGGFRYSITISPEPAELLEPISLRLPYNEEQHPYSPRFGLWDDSGNFFLNLKSVLDTDNKTINFDLPAGKYPPASASSQKLPPALSQGYALAAATASGTPLVPPVSFNKITGKMAVVARKLPNGLIEDDQHRFFIDFCTDPSNPSCVSQAFAEEVLGLACHTYDNLVSTHKWPKPTDAWIGGRQATLHIRDLGKAEDVQGVTTVGVFGQPWIAINSQLETHADQKFLYTGVTHETTHLFQRQMTTNLNVTGASWLDEGSADWSAFDTVGSTHFSTKAMEAGSNFPTVTFPQSFAGFTPEQNYGIGAFAIWLENKHPGCILKMYQGLIGDPRYWYLSRNLVAKETGSPFATTFTDFSLDYWQQNYEPIAGLPFGTTQVGELNGPSGKTFSISRPRYSSDRYSIAADPVYKAQIANRHAVIRATGLTTSVNVYVYGDKSSGPYSPPDPQKSMTLLGMLIAAAPNAPLGSGYFGDYTSYRLIVINTSDSDASLSIRVVVPHIEGMSPNSGKKTGGYYVTLNGYGFGPQAANSMVSVMGTSQEILEWSDTRIKFKMMSNLPFSGLFPVAVTTAEDVSTNAVSFDAYS
jgi:hypothetical protein